MKKAKAKNAAGSVQISGSVRCAIYCRKSTEDGLEQDFNSLDAQREACEAYIASQRHEGWTAIPVEYSDGGFTGANTDRPAMRRMLDDIAAGRVDTVVTYKVDRLSRSLLDFARLMELFDEHAVSFVSVTQNFSTTNAIGKLTLNILMSFAEFERAIITERIRDKIGASKRKGKFMGGIPPLGYDVDHAAHKLVVNSAEAETVRFIFRRFAETGSGLSIARELNAGGITTKSWTTLKGVHRQGKPWNAGQVYRMLSNRVYLGETVYKGTSYGGEHDAIISERVWDAAQSMLQANPRKLQSAHESVPALLRGIIRCGHCDRAMTSTYTRKGAKTYRYYLCTQANKTGYSSCPVRLVPAGDIEQAVVGQVRAICSTPEVVAQTCTATLGLAADQEHDLNLSQWELIDAAKQFELIWNELTPAEQRRVVGALVERVTVTMDGLDVRLRADGIHSLASALEHTTDERTPRQ